MLEFFSISRAGFVNGEFFLRNPGSSGFESSINLSMNGVVGESSVENPERIFVKKQFTATWCLLVVSLGDDRGQGGSLSLPGQHLVLDLPDLLLEVPGLGRHRLPD